MQVDLYLSNNVSHSLGMDVSGRVEDGQASPQRVHLQLLLELLAPRQLRLPSADL